LNVLDTAARHGDPVLAKDVFRVLSNRSVKLEIHHYEALLEAYASGNDVKSALTVLCAMRDAGIDPSDASTRAIYKSLRGQPEGPKEAFEALHLLRKDGRKIPIVAINCVLDASSFQGNAILALEHYKQLRVLCPDGPNTTTFNVLVRACGVSHRKDLAMFLVSEMQAMGISPDSLTYDRLLLVCLQEDNYEDAFKYLEEMERRRWTPRPGTWKALVARCATASDQRAWELADRMDEKGLDTVKIRDWLSKTWGKSDRLETTEKLELRETRGNVFQGAV
jgi:pentatricopeptide repeat protein